MWSSQIPHDMRVLLGKPRELARFGLSPPPTLETATTLACSALFLDKLSCEPPIHAIRRIQISTLTYLAQ